MYHGEKQKSGHGTSHKTCHCHAVFSRAENKGKEVADSDYQQQIPQTRIFPNVAETVLHIRAKLGPFFGLPVRQFNKAHGTAGKKVGKAVEQKQQGRAE